MICIYKKSCIYFFVSKKCPIFAVQKCDHYTLLLPIQAIITIKIYSNEKRNSSRKLPSGSIQGYV